MTAPDGKRPALGTDRGTLYRLRDASDRLLYVGITRQRTGRFHQHAKTVPWWPLVRSATFQHGATLDDEQHAIEGELPLFNVDHTERRDWIDALQEAAAAGYMDDPTVLDREMDFLCAERDRLVERLAAVQRSMQLVMEASRAVRRCRKAEAT